MSARHLSIPSAGNNSINMGFNEDSEWNAKVYSESNLNNILNPNQQNNVKTINSQVLLIRNNFINFYSKLF